MANVKMFYNDTLYREINCNGKQIGIDWMNVQKKLIPEHRHRFIHFEVPSIGRCYGKIKQKAHAASRS